MSRRKKKKPSPSLLSLFYFRNATNKKVRQCTVLDETKRKGTIREQQIDRKNKYKWANSMVTHVKFLRYWAHKYEKETEVRLWIFCYFENRIPKIGNLQIPSFIKTCKYSNTKTNFSIFFSFFTHRQKINVSHTCTSPITANNRHKFVILARRQSTQNKQNTSNKMLCARKKGRRQIYALRPFTGHATKSWQVCERLTANVTSKAFIQVFFLKKKMEFQKVVSV